jgi:predicted metal-dependent phosphoesterase TrpH
VDLHAHTTASDGILTPAELVAEAARQGLAVLAITDHDSTEGVGPARQSARAVGPLEIVPGIEINTEVGGGIEVHLLGYFLDYEVAWLGEILREFREERRGRVYRIAERLAALGCPIDPAHVFALVREGSAGRPHVARVLVQHGYVRSVAEAFDRYLGAGKPAYVSHRKVTPAEACGLIRRAGGLSVMAHPAFHDKSEALVRGLAGQGLLDGVEAYYPEHTLADTGRFVRLCQELDLVPTGGSDFHGSSVRAATLGRPSVPWEAWEALRRRAGR